MPEKSPPSSFELEFKSYHDYNGDRPVQTLIFHNSGSSWWIKVVVDWALPEAIVDLGYLQRRSILRRFIEAVDFGQLQLLEDTVTMITLSLTEKSQNSIMIRDGYQTPANYFISVAHQICYEITEDPWRVTYPTLDRNRCLPIFEASSLRNIEVITPRVSTVKFKQEKFAFKTIDHPIYEPEDTDHILDEIDILTQLRGQPNIAQLVGLVVSENPYKTYPSTDIPVVVRGFLLEYYPGGSLEQIVEEDKVQNGSSLIQWALQIGRAVDSLHKRGRSHLDIKTSNIVLDDSENAILIDISGTGGYTLEWLSPEMHIYLQQDGDITPSNAPFGMQIATDCWAYGRVLSTIAEKSDTRAGEKLQSVANDLTMAAIETRISLRDALTKLEGNDVEQWP
jgi:serine/threonine protein kinase